MNPNRFLTADEAATLLRVPVATVRQWLWDGRLPGYRAGGSAAGWRIRERDLEALLQANREREA